MMQKPAQLQQALNHVAQVCDDLVDRQQDKSARDALTRANALALQTIAQAVQPQQASGRGADSD